MNLEELLARRNISLRFWRSAKTRGGLFGLGFSFRSNSTAQSGVKRNAMILILDVAPSRFGLRSLDNFPAVESL